MARIVSYSAGPEARNFTLQQTLYDYDFRLRHTETGLNGDPTLSTPSADEVLQATLQHVVATYDPLEGRRIYVNGQLVGSDGEWDQAQTYSAPAVSGALSGVWGIGRHGKLVDLEKVEDHRFKFNLKVFQVKFEGYGDLL